MLKITKYAHPDKTVISVAALLLRRLRKRRLIKYEDLYSYLKKSCEGGEVLFVSSLCLLYLLGVIEYRSQNDSFEYVGGDEII